MSLIDRIERRAELCGAMMRRLNIDPVEAAQMTMGIMVQNISRTCMFCRRADECAAWLASKTAQDPVGYREFCPNADKFDGTLRYMEFCGRKPASDMAKTA